MIINEKCGNLRKDLKEDILQFVISLRIVFVKMKTHLEDKCKENKKLSEEFYKVKKKWIEQEAVNQREKWRYLRTRVIKPILAKQDNCFHLKTEGGISSRKC